MVPPANLFRRARFEECHHLTYFFAKSWKALKQFPPLKKGVRGDSNQALLEFAQNVTS